MDKLILSLIKIKRLCQSNTESKFVIEKEKNIIKEGVINSDLMITNDVKIEIIFKYMDTKTAVKYLMTCKMNYDILPNFINFLKHELFSNKKYKCEKIKLSKYQLYGLNTITNIYNKYSHIHIYNFSCQSEKNILLSYLLNNIEKSVIITSNFKAIENWINEINKLPELNLIDRKNPANSIILLGLSSVNDNHFKYIMNEKFKGLHSGTDIKSKVIITTKGSIVLHKLLFKDCLNKYIIVLDETINGKYESFMFVLDKYIKENIMFINKTIITISTNNDIIEMNCLNKYTVSFK
jgi:hypothetical protein